MKNQKYQVTHEYGNIIHVYNSSLEAYDDDYLFDNYQDAMDIFEKLCDWKFKNKTGGIYLSSVNDCLGYRETIQYYKCT